MLDTNLTAVWDSAMSLFASSASSKTETPKRSSCVKAVADKEPGGATYTMYVPCSFGLSAAASSQPKLSLWNDVTDWLESLWSSITSSAPSNNASATYATGGMYGKNWTGKF